MSSRKYSCAFFSNDYSFLAKKLMEKLFNKDFPPISQRMIIVPSSVVKTFLSQYFCEESHLGIFAGVKILTVMEFYHEGLKISFPTKRYKIPSALELKLFVQDTILKEDIPPDWEELREYMEGKESPAKNLRIEAIADGLAKLFVDLDTYGFSPDAAPFKNWKLELWRSLYPEGSPWMTIHGALEHLSTNLGSLHLFGFDTLPKLFCDFFKKCGANFYIFSPCQEYWEDFLTEREKAHYHRRLSYFPSQIVHAFDAFTKDAHPLLASCGRSSRGFLSALLGDDIVTEEEYHERDFPKSVLEKIQNDLLKGSLSESKHSFNQSDRSVQIHICASKFREVEILLNSLYGVIENSNGLKASDILVLSPNLKEYVPYIQRVFGSAESILGFRLPHESPSSDLHLFFNEWLFQADYRLEKEKFLELLEFPSFRKKFSFSPENVSTLTSWIHLSGITWGFDEAHRKRLIGDPALAQIGTWSHGFSSLLEGFIKNPEEGETSPLESADFELLGVFITLVKDLHQAMQGFFFEKKKPSDWCLYIREFTEEFFCVEDHENSFIRSLEELASNTGHLNEKISFHGIQSTLKTLFSQDVITESSERNNRIRFSSFYSGNICHAKVVCLLGLDEESFPKNSESPLLEESITKRLLEKIPQKSEKSRAVFLEAIASAGETLWISYTGFDAQHNPIEPAPMASELLSVLKNSFEEGIVKTVFFEHHPCGFDKSYFMPEIPSPSFSKKYFDLAASLSDYPSPLSTFQYPEEIQSLIEGDPLPGSYEIDARDFLAFIKDIDRFYKEKILGIFSEWEEEESLFYKYLIVTNLKKRNLQRKTVLKGFKEAWEAEKNTLPAGFFGQMAYTRYGEDFIDSGVKISEIFTLKLDPFCKRIEKRKNLLVAPPLSLTLSEKVDVKLFGVLPDMSSEGILVWEDKTKKSSERASILLGLLGEDVSLKEWISPQALFTPSFKTQSKDEGDRGVFMEALKGFIVLSRLKPKN